jgi:hypothetical protein
VWHVDEVYQVMQQQVRVVHIRRHGMEAPMHQQPHGLIDDERVDLVVIVYIAGIEVHVNLPILQVVLH